MTPIEEVDSPQQPELDEPTIETLSSTINKVVSKNDSFDDHFQERSTLLSPISSTTTTATTKQLHKNENDDNDEEEEEEQLTNTSLVANNSWLTYSFGIFSNLYTWIINNLTTNADNNSQTIKNNDKSKKNSKSTAGLRKKQNSDKYFVLLFWLFVCVKFRYDLYLAVPIVVLLWKLLRGILISIYSLLFDTNQMTNENNNEINRFVSILIEWFKERRAVLAPRPILLIQKLFIKGDHKINNLLRKSMDNIITLLLLVGLIFGILIISIVLAMQVHSETLELIQIITNILNENVYAKPEWSAWLPEKDKINYFYLSTMNKFYLYGREYISEQLKKLTDDNNNSNYNNTEFLIIESQILSKWDSLYIYLSRSSGIDLSNNITDLLHANMTSLQRLVQTTRINTPTHSALLRTASRSLSNGTSNSTASASFWTILRSISIMNLSKDWGDLLKQISFIIKDNIDILMSVFDSLYTIIKSNLTLLTTISYSIVAAIFNSSFALMNFFISLIVYVTAMFYLLSSSHGNKYRPLQWISEIKINSSQTSNNSTGKYLSQAIEDSIRSVFVASLKMASFYFVYTYSIYSLFAVNVIYLPSICAGIFAVVPIFGTYWAGVPGILEIWLIQNRPIEAFVFIALLMMPTYFVDTAIYSQIKNGHPYLTSLSLAGGVYYLGLEGAFIGPIVLCLLIVIGQMITTTPTNSRSKRLVTSMSMQYMNNKKPFNLDK
jgi:predicted PurR-regulated permease PerM